MSHCLPVYTVSLPICLSVCLSLFYLSVCSQPVCLSACMCVCLPAFLSVSLSVCMSVYLFAYLYLSLPACLSVHLSFSLTACLSTFYLSICLFVYLRVCL